MAARVSGAPLDPTAPLRQSASLHEHRHTALPAFRDSALEPRAAIGPHASLDVMTNRPVLVIHPDQSVTLPQFLPAETHYICRP